VRRTARHPFGGQRHRQGDECTGCELDGGDGGRVASREQSRLDHDQGGRESCRGKHEQIALTGGVPAAGARHEAHPGQRERVAGPGERTGPGPPETRGHQGGEHRHDAEDHGGVADAGALDAGVLEQDHRTEPEGAGEGDLRREGLTQAPPARQCEQRRGGGEACHREPAGTEPDEREL